MCDFGNPNPYPLITMTSDSLHWNELVAAKKAFDYTNRNWKDRIHVLFCSPDKARPFFPEEPRFDPRHCNGLTSETATKCHGHAEQTIWINDALPFWRSFSVCAHEAFHAAVFALSSRGIPLDLREMGSCQCLAFFVEDILRSVVPALERRYGIVGAGKPLDEACHDNWVHRIRKNRVLEKMERIGLAFTHEDTTWRVDVPTVLCGAARAKPLFKRIADNGVETMEENAGLVWSCTNDNCALVWADSSFGARNAFSLIVHGAISAAGFLLSSCGVDVNVANTNSSECVANFIERYLNNICPWFLERFAVNLEVAGKPMSTLATSIPNLRKQCPNRDSMSRSDGGNAKALGKNDKFGNDKMDNNVKIEIVVKPRESK